MFGVEHIGNLMGKQWNNEITVLFPGCCSCRLEAKVSESPKLVLAMALFHIANQLASDKKLVGVQEQG